MKKKIIILIAIGFISFLVFFISSAMDDIIIFINEFKAKNAVKQQEIKKEKQIEKIAEQNHEELAEDFSDVNTVTRKIMKDNGGTLLGAFQNDEDARNKYLKYMGEEHIKELNFMAFNPQCIRVCGRVIVDNAYTVRILENGPQERQDDKRPE